MRGLREVKREEAKVSSGGKRVRKALESTEIVFACI